MLNALEELRKIRTATRTTHPVTDCTAEELLPKYPTNPTKGNPAKTNTSAVCEEAVLKWNPAASAVLDIVSKAGLPIPHSQIVKALAGRGIAKRAAYEAIAHCQERGWIGHNLVSGYTLLC